MHITTAGCRLVAVLAIIFLPVPWATAAAASASPAPSIELQPCRLPGVEEELRCGTYEVFENRRTRQGRKLPLRIVLIPARAPNPQPEPIMVILGGPGQTATEFAGIQATMGWERENHDVVLVDQRGTGEGHKLDCRLSGSDANLQGYLEPMFQAPLFRACRQELETRADLTLYTTPIAADDLDEVRQALGYERINLTGGSYGVRFILTYIRRHGAHVRTGVLTSLASFGFRNPLYHARAAQDAWDGLVGECRAIAACQAAYPTLSEDLETIRRRLRAHPVRVTIPHPETNVPTDLLLTEGAFGEAMRVLLYRLETARSLPLFISNAMRGDFAPFAGAALQSNRGLRDMLRFGMLQTVICSEDIPRIAPADIDRETAGTFLGDSRVRQQIAACGEWPRGEVPDDYAAPFESQVPALLISGHLDPATSPRWAEETARYLPNSLHLIVPGGHSPINACIGSISAAFVLRGSLENLDTSCAAELRPPPFLLPPPREQAAGRSEGPSLRRPDQ